MSKTVVAIRVDKTRSGETIRFLGKTYSGQRYIIKSVALDTEGLSKSERQAKRAEVISQTMPS